MSHNFVVIAFLGYVLYLFAFLALVRIIFWIAARTFHVNDKLNLLREQNELLREIKDKIGGGPSL